MKIKRSPGMGDVALPRISQWYYQAIYDDKIVVKKRPTQPRQRSTAAEFNRQQMLFSAGLIDFTIPEEMQAALAWEKNSNDTWKDALTRAQFGTLYRIKSTEDEPYHPALHAYVPPEPEPEPEVAHYTQRLRWQHSVSGNTTNIDYVLETGIDELFIIAQGVTTTLAQNLQLFVSVDGGATFKTAAGNYHRITNGGVIEAANAMFMTPVATTLAKNSYFYMPSCSLGLGLVAGLTLSATFQNYRYIGTTDAVNAIRITPLTTTMTGGQVLILGR